MKHITILLRVLALTVVALMISVVPASGINTAGTDTAKFCNYGYLSLPPAAEAGDRPSSP